MKTLIYLICVTIALVSASCGNKNIDEAMAASAATALDKNATAPIKADTLVLVAERVGVTDKHDDFHAFPTCDGGECMDVRFQIAVQLREKNITVNYHAQSYNTVKGAAKKDADILKANKIYETLKKINANEVAVTTINGEVVKIASREQWLEDNTFQPAEVFWVSSSVCCPN